MSAIAGAFNLDGRPVDASVLARMEDVLAPYGPDRGATWREGGAGLLSRVLRVTLEDTFDRQPLISRQGRWAVVADGRIYNREDLARALEIPAGQAQELADSTFILKAVERWGVAGAGQLLGDFAFAAWDRLEKRLYLTRDPLGHRALYWYRRGRFVAFATVPSALLALPEVPREINADRFIADLALLPVIREQSLLKGIHHVLPAHTVTFADGQCDSHRYHRFDPERRIRFAREEEYVERARELLGEAVRCRLRSATPIASHLSSGLDSATVTATAAGMLAQENRSLLAYTAVPPQGFEGPVPPGRHGDEGPYAASVVAGFDNIEHVLIRTGGSNPADNLADQTACLGLGRIVQTPENRLWLDAIAKDAASRGARVLLNGQHGNMTLTYGDGPFLANLIAQGRILDWLREAAALRRAGGLRWRGLLAGSLGPWVPAPVWRSLNTLRGQSMDLTLYSPLHPSVVRSETLARLARESGWDLDGRPGTDSWRERIAILFRQDKGDGFTVMKRVAGIELRAPLGDLRLVEFCLSLPDEQFFAAGESRRLVRRAMAGVLPMEFLHKPTTGLQAANWFEGLPQGRATAEAMLNHLERLPEARQLLDLKGLGTLLNNIPDHGFDRRDVILGYRAKLLRGLAAGAFLLQIYGNCDERYWEP